MLENSASVRTQGLYSLNDGREALLGRTLQQLARPAPLVTVVDHGIWAESSHLARLRQSADAREVRTIHPMVGVWQGVDLAAYSPSPDPRL
jgi:hypothetical protein